MSQKNILLRIQSPDGQRRVELPPNSTLRDLYEAVYKVFDFKDYGFALYKERNYTAELSSSNTQKLDNVNLKHGELLFLKQIAGSSKSASATTTMDTDASIATAQILKSLSKTSLNSTGSSTFITSTAAAIAHQKEDEVDQQLAKIDGRIHKGRDAKLCRHNSNGSCVHCTPIEPWDATYLAENKIKHISFHSYIRKLSSGVDRGKFMSFDDLDCKIKSGCREHPPWPKGICSKCQPSAITLNRQQYRHVDNIMFENPSMVERFLNYWRVTGHQRMGFLYGTYEIHPDVPLGIRARISAIYEPPQESTKNSIRLLEDEHNQEVDEVAAGLGMKKVGWIFTDLLPDDPALGTVKHIRGIETFFLTADECLMAGHLQNQHPNVCKYSSNGYFGSKFVTVCVTGDATNHVHMDGYAVSAQCMALVRDNCLISTRDAPGLGYVRESTDKQFVPDVYYKEKDQYNNEVSRMARPLPVEYLLVNVPATTPRVPIYTFTARDLNQMFPVENRYIDGHLQDFNTLTRYLSRWDPFEFMEAISDFHLLLYLSRMDMLPMKASMAALLEAVRTQDKDAVFKWKEEDVWCTLETIIAAGPSVGSQDFHENGAGGSSSAPTWTCSHCTLINKGELNTCEICGLPRG